MKFENVGRSTSQVTRTTVAYGSRNQNKYCSCGNRLRSLESVVCINSAGRFSTKTGFLALLLRQAFLTGKRCSKLSLTLSHKSLTSSTVTKDYLLYEKELIQQIHKFDLAFCQHVRRGAKVVVLVNFHCIPPGYTNGHLPVQHYTGACNLRKNSYEPGLCQYAGALCGFHANCLAKLEIGDNTHFPFA